MVYSKTDWLETAMSTAEKLTALDNLEGMYGQLTTYIDAITHSGNYYTDAEAAAKFFSSSTDGTGSGLICTTLDGQTAQQIIDAGSPPGVIAWWSGSEVAIPSGWVLCNGLNSTPDLRNRFVVGAGSHYVKGDTGGVETVTTAATIAVADHTLTSGEIAKHTHGITDYYNAEDGVYWQYGGATVNFAWNTSATRSTGYTGGGDPHTHTGSWAGTASQVKVPPYYALCFIMKS